MIKADYSFYFLAFKGNKLSEDDAEKYLEEAAYQVLNFTYGRTAREDLTNFQIDMIKRAICAQAEHILLNPVNENGNISSYSADGVSITFDTSSKTDIPALTRNFLLPTGLLNPTMYY